MPARPADGETTKRRFKVLHLITRLELGGAQQNTLYCTRHHDREHFEVHLIAGPGGRLDADAESIPNAQVRLLAALRHPVSPWWDLVSLFRLRRYLIAEGIDLLHTHSSKAGLLGRIAAAIAGVPVVVHTVHGWSFNDSQAGWRRRLYITLEKLVAPLTDRLIVVSSRNRDEGLKEGIGRPAQYQVVHSGIDIRSFTRPDRPRDETRRGLGFAPSDIVVGTIACLKPQKAPLDFVRAAEIAVASDARLKFFIAGDGELRSEVEALVRERGLESHVQLLGWRDDVVDLLHACDIFLLTSLFEGLPRAVLQAMAAGVPVVATDVDGTPEVVVPHRTGLLVPPGRPEAAAGAVLELVKDPALRESCVAAARAGLTSRFEIDEMVRELDRTYLSLLCGENGFRRSARVPATDVLRQV